MDHFPYPISSNSNVEGADRMFGPVSPIRWTSLAKSLGKVSRLALNPIRRSLIGRLRLNLQ